MCLIGVACDLPGPWLLAVAANRDEFHERRAIPARYWNRGDDGDGGRVGGRHGREAILAGQDLQGGGTWLGLRRAEQGRVLRVAALTNLRPGLMPERNRSPAAGLAANATALPSRGQLVTAFLSAESAPAAFLQGLEPPATAYAGFNLFALSVRPAAAASAATVDAWYLNNLPDARARRLGGGIHTVSNATLDVPWSKTERLREALRVALDSTQDPATLQAQLFAALDDRTPAADADLPRTGLEPVRERLLSAPFIVDDVYGTRCSTVIVLTRGGEGLFCERSFGAGGQPLGTVTERFRLGAAR